jgi:hypothetical protein
VLSTCFDGFERAISHDCTATLRRATKFIAAGQFAKGGAKD